MHNITNAVPKVPGYSTGDSELRLTVQGFMIIDDATDDSNRMPAGSSDESGSAPLCASISASNVPMMHVLVLDLVGWCRIGKQSVEFRINTGFQ